jgi:polar amino acid transport system substrate-binding protein
MSTYKRLSVLLSMLIVLAMILSACGEEEVPTATPKPAETVEETVEETAEETAEETVEEVKDLLDQVMEAGVLVVSSDPNYFPQSFLNDEGELDGFDVDVAKEVARRLGVDIEFTFPDWDMVTGGNWAGRQDVSIGSMTVTEDRSEVLWFTDGYYFTPASFAVHKDNTTITSPEDLTGKTVGLGTATTYEQWFAGTLAMIGGEVMYDAPPGVSIQPYGTDGEAIQDLALGDGVRLDAVMSAMQTIQAAIDEGIPIKLVGTPAFYEPLAFALDKSRGPSDKMLAKLNEILAGMHADGTLVDLAVEWHGFDDTTMVMPSEAEVPEEDVIVIGTTDKVTVLDPADSYDFHTWEIHHNTMDTLLHYVPGTTDLEPGLATDMPEVSEDGLEYTFHLVEGASFPDGTPFNAEAVKWSIDRVIALEGDPNWLVSSFVDSVEVVDEYTVKFVLSGPVNYFPLLVAELLLGGRVRRG